MKLKSLFFLFAMIFSFSLVFAEEVEVNGEGPAESGSSSGLQVAASNGTGGTVDGSAATSSSGAGESSASALDGLSFRLVTDFAYYPESAYVAGGDHFAPITGPFSGIEARVTGWADYEIATPLGQHWLVKDANVKFSGGIELSPVTVISMLQCNFTPLPFLVFGAGASFGAGWNIGPFGGLRILDQEKVEYKDYNTFKNNFYDFWLQGTFQFDTGAIWKGDWTHVVMVASYKAFYEGLTFTSNDEIWQWRTTMNKANGWQWAAEGILAYQMPLVLKRAGLIADFTGHYDSADYANFPEWGGDFTTIDIMPFTQFQFGKKDSLLALLYFRARHSFVQEHEEEIEEPFLTHSGNEWFFRRIALSWTHSF